MSDGFNSSYPVFSNSSAHPQSRADFYPDLNPDVVGPGFAGLAHEDKIVLFKKILAQGIHGICYSPYLDGQAPGMEIPAEQIQQRMRIIQPYTNWIRTFSCREGHQETARIARQLGLKTMVGVGIGKDHEINEVELRNGIEVARSGNADILAIGNEVLLRGDISEDELIGYMNRAKQAVPNVPIGYVDAYFLFEQHPRIAAACDVLLINCYPFWERCPAEYALPYMKEMYRRAVRVANGKKVIISETGWPNIGSPYGAAVPGPDQALSYFINTCLWAAEDGIEIFYFSAFDESWKIGDEGDVGAYWGLWDQDGNLKYVQDR